MATIVVSSQQASAWWVWTIGDHVDNTSQSSVVNGYKPTQPIPFSHKLHAGDRKIECQYCHTAARRSPSAGIPPLNTCMGCHKFVNTEADPIKYVKHKYEANEPIKWIRVHDMPDYVRFSHQPHVLAKGPDGKPLLECQTCHGQVEKMEVVEQYAPLQMGWCLDCHNSPKGTLPGQEPPKNPALDASGKVATNAPRSCNTCHY